MTATLTRRPGKARHQPLGAMLETHIRFIARHSPPERWIELAAATRTPQGLRMRRGHRDMFTPAGEASRAITRARRLARQGHEVMVSPIARDTPSPKKQAVTGTRLVWVDIDNPDALTRAQGFGRPAHLVVATGSGGAHLYWALTQEIPVEYGETVNRRLAAHLGADMAATDRARILRLAGTTNGKVDRPAVLIADRPDQAPWHLGDLLAGVPPLPVPPPAPAPRPRPPGHSDDLHQVTPPEYFQALTGLVVPDRGGFVRCPIHEERTASCQVYPTPERGWWCWGCNTGGSLYDLASALKGGPTGRYLRGPAFLEARAFVQQHLS